MIVIDNVCMSLTVHNMASSMYQQLNKFNSKHEIKAYSGYGRFPSGWAVQKIIIADYHCLEEIEYFRKDHFVSPCCIFNRDIGRPSYIAIHCQVFYSYSTCSQVLLWMDGWAL